MPVIIEVNTGKALFVGDAATVPVTMDRRGLTIDDVIIYHTQEQWETSPEYQARQSRLLGQAAREASADAAVRATRNLPGHINETVLATLFTIRNSIDMSALPPPLRRAVRDYGRAFGVDEPE